MLRLRSYYEEEMEACRGSLKHLGFAGRGLLGDTRGSPSVTYGVL